MYGDRTHQFTLWPLDESEAQQDSGAAQTPTGVELVGQMAHGKPWWKLQPIDLAPWIRSLPKAVRTCKYNRLEWIGRGWDGVSEFHLGEEPWNKESDINFGEPLWEFDGEDPAVVIVSADQLRLLVAELRRMISAAPALGVALPDHRSVRACLAGPEGSVSDPTNATLTIDFDLGDLMLPLSVEDWQLGPQMTTTMVDVASLMFHKLVHAARHRKRLLRRELDVRRTFEAIMANIGDGAAPLWLRLEPLPFDAAADDMTRLPYVASDIRLDLYQVWSPHGLERVRTAAKLAKSYESSASAHRRKVALLRWMRATGSEGWISDVALALIEERDLNPAEVFRQERDAALRRDRPARFAMPGRFGLLSCRHGILHPDFDFEGGNYHDGKLTVRGSFPVTIASGAKGQPLAAIVDHPAFVMSGAVVERAEWFEERLEFYHTPRLVTVEEAERRWIASSSGRPHSS